MWVVILVILILIGRGAYIAAESRWGVAAGVVSCLLAFVLPFLTLCFWINGSEDAPSRKTKGNKSGKSGEGTSSTKGESEHVRREQPSGGGPALKQRLEFLRLLSCMMAKLAKADGRVDESEIQVVEQVFSRLGFDENQRLLCISTFRDALKSDIRIGMLARMFVSLEFNFEVRHLVYEILWDIACADGVLDVGEKAALREAAIGFNFAPGTYERYYRQWVRAEKAGEANREESSKSNQHSELDDAYEELGCTSSSTDETLKETYRTLAKRLHPDILRAQGMPESLMARANERMARINRAWERIKKARNIR